MVDRGKVIKGLEICICFGNGTLYDCTGCPYDTKELQTKCITKMQEDVLDLLKEQEVTPSGWISVKDRLPEPNEAVLAAVYDSDGQAYHTIAVHYPCGDWDSDDDYFNMSDDVVRFWMPLPEPPKEDEE